MSNKTHSSVGDELSWEHHYRTALQAWNEEIKLRRQAERDRDEARAERDAALKKADQFERDWVDAKHEWFTKMAKLRDEHRVALAAAQQERDRLQKAVALRVELLEADLTAAQAREGRLRKAVQSLAATSGWLGAWEIARAVLEAD